MVRAWFVHGSCMVRAWFVHGLGVVREDFGGIFCAFWVLFPGDGRPLFDPRLPARKLRLEYSGHFCMKCNNSVEADAPIPDISER